jgi:hypothetical protein
MRTCAAPQGADASGRGEATRRSLTPAQQDLLGLFQTIRYGRIHRLRVRSGQPDLDAGAPWTRTVKVLGENAPHPCNQAKDFTLRREVVQFFRLLHTLGDGEITDLQIRDGLPFSYEVSGSHP